MREREIKPARAQGRSLATSAVHRTRKGGSSFKTIADHLNADCVLGRHSSGVESSDGQASDRPGPEGSGWSGSVKCGTMLCKGALITISWWRRCISDKGVELIDARQHEMQVCANVSAASTLWGKTIPCPTCGDPIRPPKVEPTFPPWLESLGRTVQCVYIGGFALGIVLALARPDGGLWSGLGGMFSVVVVIVTIELAADRVVQEIRRLRVRAKAYEADG